jgi:hypothetical protein
MNEVRFKGHARVPVAHTVLTSFADDLCYWVFSACCCSSIAEHVLRARVNYVPRNSRDCLGVAKI